MKIEYCRAEFNCYAVGNSPETKGCLMCKNRKEEKGEIR